MLHRIKEKIVTFFKTQSTTKKILAVGLAIASIIVVGFFLLVIMVWTEILGPLPSGAELRAVENPVATEVFSADSVLLGRYFVQERSDISYSQIPDHVVDALICTEDARFYKHSGIDTKSLFRVLIKSILLQNESAGGGSTITQQLAKNLFPRKKYFLFSLPINKIREMITAIRLENQYDKQEIITLYFNTIPFGDNTYGLETAAQRFFGVPAKRLTIAQGAVLVGMLKATYGYNPRLFPERALQRRSVVLGQMEKYSLLSEKTADSIRLLPLDLHYTRITHHSGMAPYFREYIRQELLTWTKEHNRPDGKPYNLYTDGLKIYTTIDSRMQRFAEDGVRSQMEIIQQRFSDHWGKTAPWKAYPALLKDAIKRSDRYKSLEDRGLSEEEINKVMNTSIPMTVFTWQGEKEIEMSPLDSIKYYLNFLQAGVVAMRPEDGSVLAWVGGIDHHYFQYDHVRASTRRQVGSTFKPIVYAAALEQGVRPCEFTSAEKTTYTNMDEWKPENTDENYDMKFSMEGALAYSVNTVSVKVLEKAGINNTISLARKMGISSPLPAVPSLALGTADISMIEMVTAYCSFANNGKAVKPYYITSITSHDNTVLENFAPVRNGEQVLSSESAQLIVQMLKRTVNEGTAAGLRTRFGIQNDIAGKTGTTQSNADGWFMAIMPKMVVGAWVGADDPRIRFRTTSLGQGARTAMPIVGKMLQEANQEPAVNYIVDASFPPLSGRLDNKLSCALFKTDKTVLERIFGKKEKEEKRAFGEPAKKKKGFFRKLFGS